MDGRSAHDARSRMRASGSMDTSIADMGRLAASSVRGDGMSAAARAELIQWQLTIATGSQFPSRQPPPASPPLSSTGRGPGRDRLQGSARGRLRQGRTQGLHGQHGGLHGGRQALRGDPLQRRSGRAGVSGPGAVSSWPDRAAPGLGARWHAIRVPGVLIRSRMTGSGRSGHSAYRLVWAAMDSFAQRYGWLCIATLQQHSPPPIDRREAAACAGLSRPVKVACAGVVRPPPPLARTSAATSPGTGCRRARRSGTGCAAASPGAVGQACPPVAMASRA